MNYVSGELRRAERLTDQVTAQLSSVLLGSFTRDLCRLDLETPVAPGEICMRGCVNHIIIRNLLVSRGFQPSGWSGEGPGREPVYSRAV